MVMKPEVLFHRFCFSVPLFITVLSWMLDINKSPPNPRAEHNLGIIFDVSLFVKMRNLRPGHGKMITLIYISGRIGDGLELCRLFLLFCPVC